ncbi:MAG TPA: hypothetical protein VKD90_10400 [Gemmataceae bacterium]|nr:hypothetical protein [Gemmataceae bacterium]
MTHSLSTRRLLPGACVALALLTVGCGGPKIKLVPAEGTLTIAGRPAANVSIQFMPDVTRGGNGPTSYATTDAQGKFRLVTYDGQDGAVEGPHTVILADLEEERPPQGQPVKKLPRLDSRYTTAAGGLTAEVKAGTPIVLAVP